MNPDRRQELLARREQMQARLREARAQEAYYYGVRWLASDLERRGIPFAYGHDAGVLADWLRDNFLFLDEEIDVNGLDHRRLRRLLFSRDAEGEVQIDTVGDVVLRRWLRSVRSQRSLQDETVRAFYNRRTPTLDFSLVTLLQHPEALCARDCWFIPDSRAWVIECRHDALVWTHSALDFGHPS